MRQIVVAVLGGLLTLAGIALLALPGPGFVLVAPGLAILSTRFPWARKPLDYAKALDYAKDKAREGIEEVGEHRWRAVAAVVCAVALVALGVLVLAGVALPLVNASSAVLLVLSDLFLVGTVVYARRRASSRAR
jgi:hypothetical protein